AIRLGPGLAEAHCNLGQALRRKGQFAESLQSYRRGHELGSRRELWRYTSGQWVLEAERYVALEKKLPAVLAGQARPAAAREEVGLGEVCFLQRRYDAAARLYAGAFATQPALVDDLTAGHRHRAAFCAALASCGQGEAPPAGPQRQRWRHQALAWF